MYETLHTAAIRAEHAAAVADLAAAGEVATLRAARRSAMAHRVTTVVRRWFPKPNAEPAPSSAMRPITAPSPRRV